MFVTHLECSLTGELYAANQPHNLSKAGKPLLVRYDIERARQTLTRESVAAARARHVEMARTAAAARRRGAGQPRRTGNADHPAHRYSGESRRCEPAGQGRGPPADRVVQGARAGDGGLDGQAVRHRAHRDADQRQCRRGACGLCGARGDGGGCRLPGRNARDQRPRNRGLWRSGLGRRRPDRRVRRAGPRRARRKGAGSIARR